MVQTILTTRAAPRWVALVSLVWALLPALALPAAESSETLGLQSPAVSANAIAFVYGGDIWTTDRTGHFPRRLTQHAGMEGNPRYSSDGSWLAFNASHEGNTDVYNPCVRGRGAPAHVPSRPRRRLWMVSRWKPDSLQLGSKFNHRPVQSTLHDRPGWRASHGDSPPTGGTRRIFARWKQDRLLPLSPIRTWKRYRGGRATPIGLFDLPTKQEVEIPREISNDTHPMWMGRKIYFLSDRHHTTNLFAYDIDGGTVRQLTRHTDYDVLSAAAGGGVIIYD